MAPEGPCVRFIQGHRAGPLLIDLLLCAAANEQTLVIAL